MRTVSSVAYQAAIETTERAIQRRAILYRNQVGVFGLVACAILAGAALYSWRVLADLAFLMPISGAFLVLDARIVSAWRLALLPLWIREEIDFTAFRQAITAHPKLPSSTLSGMLALLPMAQNLVQEQAIHSTTRHAVATVVTANGQVHVDHVVWRVIASAIVAAAVVAVVAMHQWQPLWALLLLALLPVLRRWRRARIVRAADGVVENARQTAGFDEQAFVVLKETVVSTGAE
jgi:hypothetical protein